MAEITPEGIIKKSYEDYLLEIQDGWRTIFGDNMVFGAETPQGQITSLLALMASDFENQIVDVGRSLDIDQARSQQLDDLTSLMSVFRLPAQNSSVEATIGGAEGTVVPSGSKASLLSGEVFSLRDDVYIDDTLTVKGLFISDVAGSINVPSDSLTTITTPIIGWDTVTNENAGTIGGELETDAELTRRYYNELYIASQSLMNSIISGVQSIPEVTTASGVENDTPAPISIGSVTVPSHGFVLIAEGGSSQDIAEKIRQYKSVGSNSLQMITCSFLASSAITVPTGSIVNLAEADNLAGGSIQMITVGDISLDGTNPATGYVRANTADDIEISSPSGTVELTQTITDLTSVLIDGSYKFVSVIIEARSPSDAFVMQYIPINFMRVVEVPVEITLTLAVTDVFPPDGIQNIKNNLLAYFNGSDVFTNRFELDGLEIGEDVSESRLYTPINMVKGHSISAFVLNKEGGSDVQIIDIEINERATLSEGDISISTSA